MVRPVLRRTGGRLLTRAWTSRDRFVRTVLFDAARDCPAMDLVLRQGAREQYVLNARDDMICRAVFTYGDYDFAKFERAASILRRRQAAGPLDLLIDVGANIGTICIPAVNRGFAARAIAVEPHPVNCRLLRCNTALNGLSERIVVHECVAGPADGPGVEIALEGDNWGDVRVASASKSSVPPGGQRLAVPSRRVDDLAANCDAGRTLLWVDTQGFEASVLQGASALVARQVPLVIEFDPALLAAQPGGVEALVDAVSRYEFFIDLEGPERERPVIELASLRSEMTASRRTFTDLLLL